MLRVLLVEYFVFYFQIMDWLTAQFLVNSESIFRLLLLCISIIGTFILIRSDFYLFIIFCFCFAIFILFCFVLFIFVLMTFLLDMIRMILFYFVFAFSARKEKIFLFLLHIFSFLLYYTGLWKLIPIIQKILYPPKDLGT